jgi:DNA-binding MarR family transcriptional regulator
MVRDPYEPTLAWLLNEVKEDLVAQMRERLWAAGHTGVRAAHGHVFRQLRGGPARLTDMADGAGMTKQSFAEHVIHLERLGYVERVPDPEDGRAKLVVPTARGQEAMAIAQQAFADLEDEWGDALGAERVAQLRSTLADLHARATVSPPCRTKTAPPDPSRQMRG